MSEFPSVNLKATGENIIRLRKLKGLSVRQIQDFFGFEQPQAIYKWQRGECLPSVDNLFALSKLLGTSIDTILVGDGQDFFVPRIVILRLFCHEDQKLPLHFLPVDCDLHVWSGISHPASYYFW